MEMAGTRHRDASLPSHLHLPAFFQPPQCAGLELFRLRGNLKGSLEVNCSFNAGRAESRDFHDIGIT